MSQNYEKLFSHYQSPEPSYGLLGKIMKHIESEKRLSVIKWRVAVFFAGLLGSLAALFPVIQMLQARIVESGFGQFLSLLFSDFGTVATYWQSFSLSLLETLPVLHLAMFLALIFALMEFLKFFVRDIKFIFLHSHHISN